MSAADRALLLRAAELQQPLARAARIGRGNGLGYVVFGVLSLLVAVVGFDLVGLIVGGVVLGVGLWERKQAARLLAADTDAPGRLARGELTLLAAIAIYAVAGLVLPPDVRELQRQLGNTRDLGIDLQRLTALVSTAWYGSVLLVSLLYQGGLARYFLGRRAAVARYLEEVPAWARTFVASMHRA